MVVTGSGDKTVRIWSLTDYSCLRTFEGHANSVLKVVWLPPPGKKAKRGVQVGSAAGDGLVKVWNAQDGECAATLDNHIDRVWALAVRPKNELKAGSSDDEEAEAGDDEQLELVSGSADSTLTFWTDTTATTALAATTHATARIEQDQQLQNHIRSKNFREAIVLALQLDHPKRLLELFGDIVSGPQEPGSFTGRLDVDDVLKSLSGGQLWNLVCRVRDWNANGRTKGVAQKVLYALLRLFPKERLLALGKARKKAGNEDADAELAEAMAELDTRDKSKRREGMKDVVDGLKAYTERHYTRLEKTGEERFVLLWALGQMDDVAAINGKAREEDIMMLEG
jgi:U3 small nucleolar RNA-associated protein 13